MATPRSVATPTGGDGWNGPSQAVPSPAQGPGHVEHPPGLQVRPMGLKVHYTFDREAKINCLARHPQTVYVRTIPIDDTNSIGIVDLRTCLLAVIECSPELADQDDGDYAIYAVDYSELDSPLVGQGMLSWALNSMRGDDASHQPKLVTGRITKNLLAVFGGGNRETLEIRLKLSKSSKVRRHAHHDSIDQPLHRPLEQTLGRTMEPFVEHPLDRPMEMAMTPTGTSEWNSFMQANPQFGHTAQVSRLASPTPSQCLPPAIDGREPFDLLPTSQQGMPPATQEVQRVAPTPVDASEQPKAPAASSRPSSRASNGGSRKKPATGRPRGRPRKRPAEGNTSGCEDGPEGEEGPGPAKKRAMPVKVDKSTANPFATEPESLRVAASTSGSLRTFRPVAASSEGPSGSGLHEVRRAPTPFPDGGRSAGRLRGSSQSMLRREPMLGQHQAAATYSDAKLPPTTPKMDDSRSPESMAPTPAFSEDSMASSPPVQHAAPFMRSSPPPSSPVLPPMPPPAGLQHHESSFNDEMDYTLGEDQLHPAPSDALPTRAHRAGKPMEPRMPNGVPIQVFQMQDGPAGRDMVHICSYNGAPVPAPAGPAPQMQQMPATQPSTPNDAPSLPPLKKDPPRPRSRRAPAKKKPRPAPPVPAMEPSPPPTTDNVERPMMSPSPMSSLTQDHVQPTPFPTVESARVNIQQPPEPTAEPVQSIDQPDAPTNPVLQTAAISQQQQQDGPPTQPQTTCGSSKPKSSRPLVRSQSAGAAASLPAVANSEPAGPSSSSEPPNTGTNRRSSPSAPGLKRAASSGPLIFPVPPSKPACSSDLSQSAVAEPGRSTQLVASSEPKRAATSGSLALPVPASDPVKPSTSQHVPNQELPRAPIPFSDAALPPSSPPQRSNKNIVKKHAIKQRLEEAIMNGEMPPFCSNCGAIETPTWRKIWIQDREGMPGYFEYSEKPGKVTAIEVTKRDANEEPTSYRLIKKSLGPADDKTAWQELLLCNPCGIWLVKCKGHRPPDRWDKDMSRLGQERRRKGTGGTSSRPKKPRSKGDALANPTSELDLLTDALGPPEPSSPKAPVPPQRARGPGFKTRAASADAGGANDEVRSNPGSSHSRGSGTADSPVQLDFDEAVGSTKRLLFPSPRQCGVAKLKWLAVEKDATADKENKATHVQDRVANGHDDLEALFQSPLAAGPSTPPPNGKTFTPRGSFKTPTRPTPNHRPITRSVSRSLRSMASIVSPSQILLQQTPTKTPRAAFGTQGSAGRRRSPRNHQGDFDVFNTPFSRSIDQIFSDAASYGILQSLDLSALPLGEALDFGSGLELEGGLSTSPSKGRPFLDFNDSDDIWPQWDRGMEG